MNFRVPPKTTELFGWTACFILVFISAFSLSGTRRPLLELDPSWNVALEYAAAHHWQFGTQIVFTFGPLGFLAAPASLGHLLGTRVAFAFFWSAVVALTAITLAKRLPGWVRYGFLGWLIVFTLSEGLDQTAFWLLASGTLLLLLDKPGRRWQAPVYILAFIALALIKTSFFTAGIISGAVVFACWLRQGQFKSATVLAIAGPAGFIMGWKACGQSIANIAPWVRHGLELESGYSAAMNLVPKTYVLCAALAGLALFAAAVFAMIVRGRRDFLAWAVAITLAQYGFLAWKEGFTRSGDWHDFVFLWFLPLGMAFFLLQDLPAAPSAPQRWALNFAFAASIVLSLAGAHFQIPGFALQQVAGSPQRFSQRAQAVAASLGGRTGSLYADCRDAKEARMLILDHAQDAIGNQSVDVMNYLPLAAVINGLNYQPRPVFQGFVAYTPALERLNEEYFESTGRAHYVMLCQQATDGRFPALEDSAALNYVLNNYVPVARDGRFMVLQQQTAENPELHLVHEETLHFGEMLDLSLWKNGPLFMSIEIKPGLMGRAVTLLYQQRALFMRVSGNHEERQYRIVPSMAERPFLVSPVLDSNFDVMNLFTSQPGKEAESVTFPPPAHASFEFRDSIHVRLFTAPSFPQAAKAVSAERMLADLQGRVFWPPPRSVESSSPVGLVIVHGTAAWKVRAPSSIIVDIPPNAPAFTGYFGVPTGANSADASPPHVAISIVVQDQSHKIQWKLERILNPSSSADDRGRFSFRVPIDGDKAGTITLTTEAVPGGSNDSVSFWSQCRFDEHRAH
jgi:hypothetical protein